MQGTELHRIDGFALIPAILMMLSPLTALAFMAFDSEIGPVLQAISVGMFTLGLYVAGMSLKYVFQDDPSSVPAVSSESN